MRRIRIVKETEHFIWIAPPDPKLTHSAVLDELEFLVQHGFRPLFPLQWSAQEGWICEKMAPPR